MLFRCTSTAYTEELTPEQRDKILTQVEFYFSDANLPTDAFLMKKVKSNPEGWVPLHVIVSFNRMKQLLKKNPPKVVAEILTEKSEALVVNDEGTQIRRATPLPKFDIEDVQARTIVAENFGPNFGGVGVNLGGGDGPSVDAVSKVFSAAGKVLMVGLYSCYIQLAHSLKAPAFNPLTLQRDMYA